MLSNSLLTLYSSLKKYLNNLLHASKAMRTDNGLMGGVMAHEASWYLLNRSVLVQTRAG